MNAAKQFFKKAIGNSGYPEKVTIDKSGSNKSALDAINTDIIFSECKSHNKFEKKDIQRMEDIAKHFPGAYMVFSTLNESLTSTEMKLLKPLVNTALHAMRAKTPALSSERTSA